MSDETTNPEHSSVESNPSDREIRNRPPYRRALLVLMISFGINVAFWGSFICRFWTSASTEIAVGSCVAFIAIMVAVHWIGFQLWRQQFVQVNGQWRTLHSNPLAAAYISAAKLVGLEQGIIFILALLMLDGGVTFRIAVIAIAAYWAVFTVIAARRPTLPARGDILFVRYGFLLIFVSVFVVALVVWRALGRL